MKKAKKKKSYSMEVASWSNSYSAAYDPALASQMSLKDLSEYEKQFVKKLESLIIRLQMRLSQFYQIVPVVPRRQAHKSIVQTYGGSAPPGSFRHLLLDKLLNSIDFCVHIIQEMEHRRFDEDQIAATDVDLLSVRHPTGGEHGDPR
jgi:hypothetical protein